MCLRWGLDRGQSLVDVSVDTRTTYLSVIGHYSADISVDHTGDRWHSVDTIIWCYDSVKACRKEPLKRACVILSLENLLYCRLLTWVLLPLDIVLVLLPDGHLTQLSCKRPHLAHPAKMYILSNSRWITYLLNTIPPSYESVCNFLTNNFDLFLVGRENDQNQNGLKITAKSIGTFFFRIIVFQDYCYVVVVTFM